MYIIFSSKYHSFYLKTMKMLILLSLLLLFKNAINQTEAGNIKHEKSFDQIFGQRWHEGTEENTCQIDQIMHRETADQNQNGQKFDQILDENLEVKKEESEEIHISDEFEHVSGNNGQICDQKNQNLNDKRKREIVEKFHKIKEKIKQMREKYSKKEWQTIERKIAQKLGAKQKKIYEWKREFGFTIKNRYSYEEKHEILNRFYQIYEKLKMKLNEKLKAKKEKCQKILAKHLGVTIRSINRWKKEIKNGKSEKNQKINVNKKETVEKYFKLKNGFIQNGKHSQKEWKEFIGKIKENFGVTYVTIDKWAKKLGNKQNAKKERKILTIAENVEKTKKYYQMKKQNPKLTDREIAAELNIPISSLYKSELMGEAKKF